jgi:hypothetical protein
MMPVKVHVADRKWDRKDEDSLRLTERDWVERNGGRKGTGGERRRERKAVDEPRLPCPV